MSIEELALKELVAAGMSDAAARATLPATLALAGVQA